MENLICVLKDAEEVKSGSYEVPREMNTVENYTQHLPFPHINYCFFLKVVTKKPGFNWQLYQLWFFKKMLYSVYYNKLWKNWNTTLSCSNKNAIFAKGGCQNSVAVVTSMLN